MSKLLGKKLVAIVDKSNIICYEASGLKIDRKLEHSKLETDKSQEKKQNSFNKNSDSGGFFDPHTDLKELENKKSAKNILSKIEEILDKGKYKEVILASSPKILGNLRKQMNSSLKNKISKQIDKDLIHSNISSLEKKIFA